MLSSLYQRLVYRRFIIVWFVINLLRRDVVRRLVTTFYLCEDDSDNQDIFDQSNISNYDCHMLKYWSYRYSNYYSIKFIGFMSIYYVINLILTSYIVFNHLYFGFIDQLQV